MVSYDSILTSNDHIYSLEIISGLQETLSLR